MRSGASATSSTRSRSVTFVDRPVDTYGGGQRRRLEIARALLSEPDVRFLDEPTVGLDPRVRHELLDLIAELRARSGVTILLTTHYLDEAEGAHQDRSEVTEAFGLRGSRSSPGVVPRRKAGRVGQCHKEGVMQFALLIYQDLERIVEGRSESELAEIAKQYVELQATPGLSQNIPLGHPKDAATVRVQDGTTMTADGTVAGPGATVASCYLFDAEDQGAAIEFAAKIPAARLGGAIEVRPVGQYW
jgi:hypothetical protein